MKKSVLVFLLFFLVSGSLAQSGPQYRRYNIMNKNLVHTVFTNGGVIGHPVDKGPRGAWLNDNNGYLGDVAPFVGCEIPYRVSADSIEYFHSVTYCLADHRPNRQDGIEYGKFWGFEPKAGYFNESKSGPAVALFTDPTTWPGQWPDRMNDAVDPGWPGQWNGYFGKGISNATEETYFAMDDQYDTEFNSLAYSRYEFHPDSTNLSRNGMGLEMKVRALQWKQFLAQDCIFWLYEIHNEGTTNYNKTTFGMLVGTYVGVTGEDGGPQEYDDDWSFFDANLDITYTGDFPDDNSRNPLWIGPVGMVGYAFLESPGNPFDGIDNDNDADDNNVFTEAAYFTESDFDSVSIETGSQVVLINDQYERERVTIHSDTTVVSLGHRFHLIPGVTKLVEGNILLDSKRREFPNPNVLDGIDNDLDGIIDENYLLHYRQRRTDPLTHEVLIDKLRPLRFVNYLTGRGTNDKMIDERRDDEIDNNEDWNDKFDDVGLDGIAGSGDYGEGDGMPTSGAAFGLPGEPHIDVTDVRESDQIGLTSFDYFSNSAAPSDILENDETWWNRVAPGRFDVPASIVNNEPVQGEDGDFFYASGYFPLLSGQTERLSLALVYGGGRGGRKKDLQDLLKNRKTVQKIYNSNYQFPKEPDTPTLSAEVGDGKVVLYWDRKAEKSFDPVLRRFDFEGYRLYKSTDPNFKDVFTVTDVEGNPTGYSALDQWDLVDGVSGIFSGSPDLEDAANGYSWNLGSETGLRHSYVDKDVENGRVYYYAISAYDTGDDSLDVFPAESPFLVTVLSDGTVTTGKNTVRVIPGTNTAGFTTNQKEGLLLHSRGPADGVVSVKIVDEKAVGDREYLVDFFDSSNDGIDNDKDWNPVEDDLNGNGLPDSNEPNMDLNDPDEFWPITTFYRVKDQTVYTDEIFFEDSSFVSLKKQHLDAASVVVKKADGTVVEPTAYVLDPQKGVIKINGSDPNGTLQIGQSCRVSYSYFPVYNSAYIGTIQDDEDATQFDTDIFDGLELSFVNFNRIQNVDSTSGWNRPDVAEYVFSTEDIIVTSQLTLRGHRTPNNYEIVFSDSAVSSSIDSLGVPATPVNFRIFNKTLNKPVRFLLAPTVYPTPNEDGYYDLHLNDGILFFEEEVGGKLNYTWEIKFIGDTLDIKPGDDLQLNVTKSFRRGDEFVLATSKPVIDPQKAASELDKIKVVPNPYVVANAHEAPLPPTITSGRGERKVTFTHLPQESKIFIFTVSGELVATIIPEQSTNFNGTANWNLKNKGNLDVAYGVYFYVVKSPVGNKRGKLAIIK